MNVDIFDYLRYIFFGIILLSTGFAQSSKCTRFPIKQVLYGFVLFIICSFIFSISDKHIKNYENINRDTLNNKIEYIINSEKDDSEIQNEIKQFIENCNTTTKLKDCHVVIIETNRNNIFTVKVSYKIQWYNIYRNRELTFYRVKEENG